MSGLELGLGLGVGLGPGLGLTLTIWKGTIREVISRLYGAPMNTVMLEDYIPK